VKAENWITLVSILATLSISLVAIFMNRHRERLQQLRDDELRHAQQARDDELRQIQQAREDAIRDEQRKREAEERTHVPHIEFSVDCKFFGPQENSYLVEVLLFVRNTGRIRQEFADVTLRLRGIQDNQPLTFWQGKGPRLCFPEALLENVPVIPEKVDKFFVEPGNETTFTYVTKIPDTIKFVLAYANFSYDSNADHDAERVFQVTAS
jgi:hypothetical protein